MANGNGNAAVKFDTKDMLRQVPSSEKAIRPVYDLKVSPEDMGHALSTDFSDYVEENGRAHLKQWIGYIDPRDVIALSRNIGRKLCGNEITLLGGPDGDEVRICELSVTYACEEAGVKSIDKLPDERKNACHFKAGWGLVFNQNGPLVHVINFMRDGGPDKDDLAKALLSLKPEGNPISIVGNKILAYDEDNQVTEASVSGKPYHITRDGKVYEGHGRLGELELSFRDLQKQGQKIEYELAAFTMTVEKLLAPYIQAQKKEKEQQVQRRVNVTRNFAASLFKGKPEAVAKGAPLD
jgi:hypothetical protein